MEAAHGASAEGRMGVVSSSRVLPGFAEFCRTGWCRAFAPCERVNAAERWTRHLASPSIPVQDGRVEGEARTGCEFMSLLREQAPWRRAALQQDALLRLGLILLRAEKLG